MSTWKIAGVVALAGALRTPGSGPHIAAGRRVAITRLLILMFCAIGVPLIPSLAFARRSSDNDLSAQELVSVYPIQRSSPGLVHGQQLARLPIYRTR